MAESKLWKGAVEPSNSPFIRGNIYRAWKGALEPADKPLEDVYYDSVIQSFGWPSTNGCVTFALGWAKPRDMGGALSIDDDIDVMRHIQRRRQLKRETEELQMLVFIVSVIDNEMD